MKAKKNAIEWTVFGVSAAVIGATVSLLVYEALSSRAGNGPDLRVTTREATRTSGGWVVPVVVANDGDATAEDAKIQIALVAEGREVEKAELAIALVPRKSRREGAVVFRRDPRCCVVTASTVAYEKP